LKRRLAIAGDVPLQGSLRLSLLFAHQVIAAVDQDAEHPRRNRRLTIESRHRSIDLQERVLDNVLRVGPATEQPERQALHPRGVKTIQTFECAQIPALAFVYKLGVGW